MYEEYWILYHLYFYLVSEYSILIYTVLSEESYFTLRKFFTKWWNSWVSVSIHLHLWLLENKMKIKEVVPLISIWTFSIYHCSPGFREFWLSQVWVVLSGPRTFLHRYTNSLISINDLSSTLRPLSLHFCDFNPLNRVKSFPPLWFRTTLILIRSIFIRSNQINPLIFTLGYFPFYTITLYT